VPSQPKHNSASRIRELLGPEFRSDFPGTLADAMHRHFDQVAQERLPEELADLARRFTGDKDQKEPPA
jgi:hypothetical protein